MRTLSFFLSSSFVLALFAVAPQAEASGSMRFHREAAVRSRPVHRSVERATREYRRDMATFRRVYKRRVQNIERNRDMWRKERFRSITPEITSSSVGRVPNFIWRTRRHVRNLYWADFLHHEAPTRIGEGPAGQVKQEEEN